MIKIEKILVPTDFSEVSLPAIRYACSLARDHAAEVFVLHAIPTEVVRSSALHGYVGEEAFLFSGAWISRIQPAPIDVLVREKRLDLYNFLQGKIEPELLRAVKVTPLVRLGEVVDEVVAAAKEVQCDLIVMTSRERTWLGRLLSSSRTQQVVRLAPCPVLSIQPWAQVSTEKGERIPVKQMQLAGAW